MAIEKERDMEQALTTKTGQAAPPAYWRMVHRPRRDSAIRRFAMRRYLLADTLYWCTNTMLIASRSSLYVIKSREI